MASNLPPGVTDDMIPGNTPEDEAWDNFFEQITTDCDHHGFDAYIAQSIWEDGLTRWREKNYFRDRA